MLNSSALANIFIASRAAGTPTVPSGPPVNLVPPSISGTPEQFQTLTCSTGVWSGVTPITYAYQWYREGDEIADADEQTYVPDYFDVGYTLTCVVTATNAEGFASLETLPTDEIALVNVPLPTEVPSMILAFEPGDPSSDEITLDQTFAPAAVDTSGNKLDLTGLDFPEFDQSGEDYKGAPVYFSSTGTLPAPLEPDTPYYLSAVSGGYAIYPTMDETHYANMPTALEFEEPMPAQNYIERTNRITLTTQGTGTHRVYSEDLIDKIYDRLGSGITIENRNSPSDRHSALRVQIDGNGRHVVSREIARTIKANTGGTYNLYGPSPVQGPGALRGTARALSANRRVVWATHVARVIPNNNRNVRKNIIAAASVNTTTGAITYTSSEGRLATGNLVKFRAAGAGNAIPTGFTAGTEYWVNVSGVTSYTVHSSLSDANSNINPIIPSDQGTGKFVVYAPQRVGDFHRQIFFQEWLEPNGGQNTLSSFVFYRGPTTGGLLPASNFTIADNGSSPENGDILGLKGFGDLTRIELWFADEAVRPVRDDTGLPLADGFYYVTGYTGGSTYGRLHDTLADAEACVGLATTACSSTDMIKFDGVTTPVGECLVVWANDATPWAFNADWTSTAASPFSSAPDVPLDYDYLLPVDGDVHTFTFLIDNNDPDEATPIGKLYIDGVKQHEWELNGTKGNTDSTSLSDQPAWTWLNSAALHVPFTGDIYATYMGASTTDAVDDAEILALHEYTFAKFNVSQGEPVPLAPSNTVLPAITGTQTTGQTLTCSAGTWAEYPAGTKTYQWKRDGSNITGATASTYLLLGEDADTMISCDVTSTNASGNATASATAVGPIVGVPAAPTVAVAGTIDGNLNEGFVLTLTPTVWSGYPAPTVAIQWKRNGSNISGATSSTYTTVSADAGTTITCTETATNASGSNSSTSNSLGPIVAAPTYETEATTLFGRMSPAPDAQLKFDINTFIKYLKDNGVWTKLDMLQVYAVPEEQYAFLDWKESSRTAARVTAGSGAIFTADMGFKGTNGVADYINTNYNSTTYGGVFSQNSCHIGVFPVSNATDVTSAGAGDVGNTRTYIITRTNSGNHNALLSATSGTYTESSISTAIQHFCLSRAASGNIQTYRDGVQIASAHTQTSGTPSNENMRVLNRAGGSTSYSTRNIAIVHAGGALTAQNVDDFNFAALTYLTARGVPDLPPFDAGGGPAANALTVGSDELLVGAEDLIVS